jgi:hypothetical protein
MSTRNDIFLNEESREAVLWGGYISQGLPGFSAFSKERLYFVPATRMKWKRAVFLSPVFESSTRTLRRDSIFNQDLSSTTQAWQASR